MQADLLTVFVRMLGVSANVQADLPTVFVRIRTRLAFKWLC